MVNEEEFHSGIISTAKKFLLVLSILIAVFVLALIISNVNFYTSGFIDLGGGIVFSMNEFLFFFITIMIAPVITAYVVNTMRKVNGKGSMHNSNGCHAKPRRRK